MYQETMKHVIEKLVKTSKQSKLKYLAEIQRGVLYDRMGEEACFAGGMFALGSLSYTDTNTQNLHMEYAHSLATTCHESCIRSATGLGPERFSFDDEYEAVSNPMDEKSYSFHNDYISSYFYLWRMTKDEKYRHWAWEIVKSLNKYCKVDTGFVGLQNVYNNDTSKRKSSFNIQNSCLMGETLKYLYLIFSDEKLISIDQWVFNTAGHPLPIKNKNSAYPSSPILKVKNQL